MDTLSEWPTSDLQNRHLITLTNIITISHDLEELKKTYKKIK